MKPTNAMGENSLKRMGVTKSICTINNPTHSVTDRIPSSAPQRVHSPQDAQGMLDSFARHIPQSLLFMRHLHTVRVRHWPLDAAAPVPVVEVVLQAHGAGQRAVVEEREWRRVSGGRGWREGCREGLACDAASCAPCVCLAMVQAVRHAASAGDGSKVADVAHLCHAMNFRESTTSRGMIACACSGCSCNCYLSG